MKNVLFLTLLLTSFRSFSQAINITTLTGNSIDVTIIDDLVKKQLIKDFKGQKDTTLQKEFTARTYGLSDGRILVEFYDKKAAVIKNIGDYEDLSEVRFTKNYIDFLKKDISYKIKLEFYEGIRLSKTAKKLINFKSEMPDYYDYEVFELDTGQILFIYQSHNLKKATVYQNIKALAAEENEILEQYYGSSDDWAQKFINGDTMTDYENFSIAIYPDDIQKVIMNHKLLKIESNIYISPFYCNLYKSALGYYILIDEVNQKNATGNKLKILSLSKFDTIEAVYKAQEEYLNRKNGVDDEHFYQNISYKYGQNFADSTVVLINKLPDILNLEKRQLTFDDDGIAIVDESIRWNHGEDFDSWYPSVLAFYGNYAIKKLHDGKWISKYNPEYKIWIPEVILSDGTVAFDVISFYKSLYEWPVQLTWAGELDSLHDKP